MIRTMLTTTDNPHSPFDDFAAWYAYDVSSGYHTAAYLARIVQASHELSEKDYEVAILNAIDEIVDENILGIYAKVEKEYPDDS